MGRRLACCIGIYEPFLVFAFTLEFPYGLRCCILEVLIIRSSHFWGGARSKDRCSWNWRCADEGLVDSLFGNVWDATQWGGSEILLSFFSVPGLVSWLS